MPQHSIPRRPAAVTAAFLAALGATTAGTVAAGASTPVVVGLCTGLLGIATAGGAVWLGQPATKEQP